jgi:hypothetical protein
MSDADLLEVMDALPLSIMQDVPGVARRIDVPGVMGFRSDVIPSPYVNLVGRARAAANTIDDTIQRVLETFEGLPFSWIVGPLSAPRELVQKLEQKGLLYYDHPMRGMVLDDLAMPMPTNSGVEVVRVSPQDALQYASELASCFGMGMTPEAMQYLFIGYRDTQVYLAFSDRTATPIGFATLTTLSPRLVLLGGAAVSEAWRGHHVYKTLVKKRLSDARQFGATTALIQAVADTAAPICRRLGFRDICNFNVYEGHVEWFEPV